MRMQPQTIRLGDRSWAVRPLTLAQVQAIEPLLATCAGTGGGTMASAVSILKLALARDHAAEAAGLDEIEAGAGEIAAAVATVLRLGGFLPGGEAPGESPAGVEPASTGGPSTPG